VRIFSDQAKNIAYIEGVCEAFTGSLIAANQGDNISIYHSGLSLFEVNGMPYTQITDAQGNGFGSVQDCLNYLQQLFVVVQNAALTFYFTTPASPWVINHNLSYVPSVKVYSMGGAEVDADVLNMNQNQVQINFVTPSTGFARLF
jgi:hypothetical protein